MSKMHLLTLLGIAALIAGILMLVIFIAERLGISPVWDLIAIPGLTSGENVILFVVFLIAGIFVALLIIVAIFSPGGKPTHKAVSRRHK